MKIKDLTYGPTSFENSTWTVAKSLVESKDALLLSGANEYNGIKWFNKEIMETTLWYAFASNCMRSSRILREQIYRLYRTLFASKELAEYKCENFLEAVKPVKLPNATKKAPAKKAKEPKDSKKSKTVAKGSKNSKSK